MRPSKIVGTGKKSINISIMYHKKLVGMLREEKNVYNYDNYDGNNKIIQNCAGLEVKEGETKEIETELHLTRGVLPTLDETMYPGLISFAWVK